MSDVKPTLSEVRSKAGANGGKTITRKKLSPLSAIGSAGRKTATVKKRDHLKKPLEARWGKGSGQIVLNRSYWKY